MGAPRRRRLPAAHRPAVPFRQRGLSRLRGFPRRARLAQAQGDPPRAARCAGRAASRSTTDRPRDLTEAAWDAFFAFYMDTGVAEMGPALPQPALLLADRRAHGRPHPPGHGAPRRAATSPARSISSAPTRSTAATGARSRSSPSCISSSATTRRSTGRSRTACRGSRRRAGRAQARARLPPDHDLFGALDRRSALPPRRRRLSRARAPAGRATTARRWRSSCRSASGDGE